MSIEQQPTRRVPIWVLILGAGAAGLVIGLAAPVAIGVITAQGADTRIGDAARACGLANKFYSTLAEDGSSLTIDAQGDESGGASYDEIVCIFDELETPQAVVSHFGQTTAMDGRQEEAWDGIKLSWSYHPDRGPDCVFSLDG
jgi:hypothetical protein